MDPKFRFDLNEIIARGERIVVDVGCGSRKKAGTIGIDKIDLEGVDIVSDLEEGLSFFPDGSVDEIHCRSVLEHVENMEGLLTEMLRVLKAEGRAHIFVPHFSNPHFYSDYTHRRFFGLYTFYYFVEPAKQLKRKVPNYYSSVRLRILKQRLVFRSTFKLFNPFKKACGRLINLHPRVQEWYEENLCHFLPCRGIEVVFTRDVQQRQAFCLQAVAESGQAPPQQDFCGARSAMDSPGGTPERIACDRFG